MLKISSTFPPILVAFLLSLNIIFCLLNIRNIFIKLVKGWVSRFVHTLSKWLRLTLCFLQSSLCSWNTDTSSINQLGKQASKKLTWPKNGISPIISNSFSPNLMWRANFRQKSVSKLIDFGFLISKFECWWNLFWFSWFWSKILNPKLRVKQKTMTIVTFISIVSDKLSF